MHNMVTLNRTRIELTREVVAVEIPAGTETTLADGALLQLVHELGGDYTVRTMMGMMFRIDGRYADALGFEVKPESLPVETHGKPTDEHVWEMLGRCFDPEIPVDIVELGLIYRMELKGEPTNRTVEVDMTLTAPGCGMGQVLMQDVERKVLSLDGVSKVNVDLTFDPPWSPERMTEEARLTTGLY